MPEKSGAMTMICSSMAYENMKFHEHWTKLRQKHDKIKKDRTWHL